MPDDLDSGYPVQNRGSGDFTGDIPAAYGNYDPMAPVGTPPPAEAQPAPVPGRVTIQQIEAHAGFQQLDPKGKRQIMERWINSLPQAQGLSAEDRLALVNRAQARYPDPLPAPTVSSIPSVRGFAPIKSYSNLKYLGGNDRGTAYMPLLDDVHKAAQDLGYTLGISSAYRPGAITTSGHTSRHASQHALDISTINGQPVTSEQGKMYGSLLAAKLRSMGFETGEHGTNKGLLWQTMVGGNHFNHLHVSYPVNPAETTPQQQKVAQAFRPASTPSNTAPVTSSALIPGVAGAFPGQALPPNALAGIPTPPSAKDFVKSLKPSTAPGPLQEALNNAAAEAGLTPEQYRAGVKKFGIAAVEKGAAGRRAQAQYQQKISGGLEAVPGIVDIPIASAIAGVPVEEAPSNILSALSERSQPGSAQALEQMPGFLPGVAKTLASFTAPSNAALMKLLGPVAKASEALGTEIAARGAQAGRTRAQEIALKLAGKAIQQGPLAPFAVQSVKGAVQQAREGDPWGAVGSLAAFFGPMAIHDYVSAVVELRSPDCESFARAVFRAFAAARCIRLS